MFLLIIKLGMRGHSASSLNSAMAGIRLPREKHAHRHSARVTPILPFLGKLKINWSVTFFSLIVLASLIGLGNALWHRHAKIQPAAAPAPVTLSDSNAKKPEPAAVASVPFNPEPLDIQLPSSNLQTAMLATLKVNALQALVNQLEDLAAQAEATRFLLTDKSTPIGQFSYPKKPRKKRKANYIASETKPEYNNNAPPYYYQQYNRYP